MTKPLNLRSNYKYDKIFDFMLYRMQYRTLVEKFVPIIKK